MLLHRKRKGSSKCQKQDKTTNQQARANLCAKDSRDSDEVSPFSVQSPDKLKEDSVKLQQTNSNMCTIDSHVT